MLSEEPRCYLFATITLFLKAIWGLLILSGAVVIIVSSDTYSMNQCSKYAGSGFLETLRISCMDDIKRVFTIVASTFLTYSVIFEIVPSVLGLIGIFLQLYGGLWLSLFFIGVCIVLHIAGFVVWCTVPELKLHQPIDIYVAIAVIGGFICNVLAAIPLYLYKRDRTPKLREDLEEPLMI